MLQICNLVVKQFDLAVVGPLGAASVLPQTVTVKCVPALPLDTFLFYAQAAAQQLYEQRIPDVILCGTAVTAPIAAQLPISDSIRLGCFLHGREIKACYMPKWINIMHVLKTFDLLIANSCYSRDLAISSGFNPHKTVVLNPGVGSLVDELSTSITLSSLMDEILGDNDPILLYVGRLIARKGLVEFVDRCLPRIVEVHPRTLLVIIGDEPKQSIFPEPEYMVRIKAAASKHNLLNKLLFLGNTRDNILRAVYLQSQMLVLPAIASPMDAEGFGMVALEAAYFGVPTTAFAVDGIPDAISHGISGYLVTPGNYDQFTNAILRHLAGIGPIVKSQKCKEYASNRSWDEYGKQLCQILTDMVSNQRVR